MPFKPDTYTTCSSAEVPQTGGFTLIELLIAMAIASIVSAALVASFQAQVRGQVSQDVSLEMTQNLRSAMDIMASDIRMAGCDPLGGSDSGFTAATATQLELTMDTRGPNIGDPPDGDTNDPGETVAYRINTGGNLGREVDDSGDAQPIALHCDALNFVYLDRDGVPFVPVTQDDRDDISAVQVSIVVGSAANAAENPGFLRPVTDSTNYVNLQGAQILKPQNDTVRRFQLSETIDCRNL